MPIYKHTNKGYDGHFLINSLNKYGYKHDDIIICIPSTEEKYVSFSKNIVVDSYKIKDKKQVKK